MNIPAWPVAAITGATGGIGRVIARTLYEQEACGWHLLGLGRRWETVERLVQESASWNAARLTQHPITGAALNVDNLLCESLFTHHLTQYTGGRLDALILAHGADPQPGAFHTMEAAAWRQVLSTDLLGSMRVCHAALPYLLQQPTSHIIIIGSFHSLGTYPERVPYATAKTGLVGLMRALAVEYGTRGVRCNLIAPGQVTGPRTEGFVARAWVETGMDLAEAMRARSPQRQLVDPLDIARTVQWLLQTPSMTGQVITLDCGWTASLWHQPYAVHETR